MGLMPIAIRKEQLPTEVTLLCLTETADVYVLDDNIYLSFCFLNVSHLFCLAARYTEITESYRTVLACLRPEHPH